jgi:hypothetical protein
MKALLLKSVFMVIMLSLFACKKKSDEESGAVCTPVTDYSSIAIINELAEFVTTDPDDWTEDAQWCQSITLLFKTDSLNLDSTVSDSVHVWAAFPNPADWHQSFSIYTTGKSLVQFIIVDESLNIKSKYSFLTHSGDNLVQYELLNDSTAHYESGHYYRMYYTAHAKDHLFFYKGHGDIQVQ